MRHRGNLDPSYRELLDAAVGVAAPHNLAPDPRPQVANFRFVAPPADSPSGERFALALRHAVDDGGRVARFGDELEVLLGGGDVRIEVANGPGYLVSS